jgi:leucine-rich repeat protein SHOC2
MTQLVEIMLEYNQLTTLPADFGRCISVLDIRLSNQLQTIPEEICMLEALTRMDISNNRLIKMPASLGRLSSLTLLSLDFNNMVELPSSIGQLTRLIDLSVLGNPILELPWALGNCTSIRSLKVDWDVVETPPVEISSLGIPSVLSFLAHVDSAIHESAALALNGYQMKTLPKAVCRLTSLTKLSLENNRLTCSFPRNLSAFRI